MKLPEGIASQLHSENIELRRMVSDLTQENFRLKIALSDALGVFNAAKSRLEAANSPGIFQQAQRTDAAVNTVNAAPEQSLSVIGKFPFRSLEVRLLSDGTLEADTPEGPLRFEDIEHLDEVFSSRWPVYDYDADSFTAPREVA